tara:strand:- start:1626 stop:2771 length:1146 start_codon:yes stop_codon:yes gene_type:complete
LKIIFNKSISEIKKKDWDSLIPQSEYPFLKYDFLNLLESSNSVGQNSGWVPMHLTIEEKGNIIAAVPLYLKNHSQGEFVFDHAWADAFYQHGLDYYPKLVSSIPHTPASGPRILIKNGYKLKDLVPVIVEAIKSISKINNISSWHILFPDEVELDAYQESSLSVRKNAQFIWFNENYKDFDDYLDSFRARHRKNVKKEREKLSQQNLEINHFSGKELNQNLMDNFYNFYLSTNLKRSGHEGYLTENFFKQAINNLSENIVLMMATEKSSGKIVGGSFFFKDKENLYGRYWGCLKEFDCLHFECCYYQGIDYCIKNNLKKFDPGVQGEHKIKRGFKPTETFSAHWIADDRFRSAIDDFVIREESQIRKYVNEAKKYLPFKTI